MNIVLDGTKIQWYKERIEAWERGEHIAPITIDLALTQACNFKCTYCYAQMQRQKVRTKHTRESLQAFIDDCAEIGVRGLSLVSDGESTLSPYLGFFLSHAHERGLHTALGTNGLLLTHDKLPKVLPFLDYLRINITSGIKEHYAHIHGVPEWNYTAVVENIKAMVAYKQLLKLKVTIGMQMVLMPAYINEVIPLVKLAKELMVDYIIIKHCSDDEQSTLGVNYAQYDEAKTQAILKEAESFSSATFTSKVKWSKLRDKNIRSYQQCYGPPFLLQISGTGTVAPCGMFFADKYKHYHMGNICKTRFKEIFYSKKYRSVLKELASEKFNAQTACGCLCLQHSVNKTLDHYIKTGGQIEFPSSTEPIPEHISFI